MNIFATIYSQSRKLAVLALLFSAGFSGTVSAADIEESDPSAPCGELQLIGRENYIYNPSHSSFIMKFTTDGYMQRANAGAVKYFERDANGIGYWRDTGVGDYRSKKTYTIPVKSHDTTTIAYCASGDREAHSIRGEVSFSADASPRWGNIPVDGVSFFGKVEISRDREYVQLVKFSNNGTTPYVGYNRKPTGAFENGSLTLCPNDPFCVVP